MITVAIDGASRRNGKPDCLAVGAVFVKHDVYYNLSSYFEQNSTNQRGELTALVNALALIEKRVKETGDSDVCLITDSEYIYNTITKGWYINWDMKGWVTAAGEPVKNQDLWRNAAAYLDQFTTVGIELSVFHVKGHLFSMGKATAASIIRTDPTGEFLYQSVRQIVIDKWDDKPDNIDNALAVFERNHGYVPPVESFTQFVIHNIVVDLYAGHMADKIDAMPLKQ